MSGASTVQFRRFDRAGARERRDIVASIYLTPTPPTTPAVRQRTDRTNLGMDTDPDTAWWDGFTTEPEPEFTVEDGHRTFALSEIMVRQ